MRTGRAMLEEGRWYCRDCADLIRDPASPSNGFTGPEPAADASPDDATVEIALHPVKARLQAARQAYAQKERSACVRARNWAIIIGLSGLALAAALLLVLLFWGG